MPRKTVYKYNVKDVIKGKYSNMKILGQIRVKYNSGRNVKGYMYKCLKCDNIDKIAEAQITNQKAGCNMCCPSPQKVVKGINDIATTHPHLIKYFKNIEDVYKYSCQSNVSVTTICPYCGKEKDRKVYKLNKEGLACSCNDKVSYPNKFITELIRQLELEYETEKIFEWSGLKRYDVYISNKYIVENHGIQHYEESPRGLSLEKEQLNDKLKKRLALENGIKEENFIVIDCRKSDLEWIKNSILNSRLSQLFDLSNINWLKCHEFALSNLVKIACEYKNNNTNITIKDVSKIMGFSTDTIRRWFKQGNKIKWCYYDSKEEARKSADNNRILKEIISINNGIIFESAREIDRQSIKIFKTKLDYRNISAVCNGVQKTHKGFQFKFTEYLTEEQIKQIQENAKLNQVI